MSKPHSAVFIAKVPRDWKPAHVNSIPPEILKGKFIARRISTAAAVEMANAYNRTHLPSEGRYRRKWAIAIADPSRNYRVPTPHLQPLQMKPTDHRVSVFLVRGTTVEKPLQDDVSLREAIDIAARFNHTNTYGECWATICPAGMSAECLSIKAGLAGADAARKAVTA